MVPVQGRQLLKYIFMSEETEKSKVNNLQVYLPDIPKARRGGIPSENNDKG